MPFARVRAPDAVQYQDVCTGITAAIGTSYSVIGGTMIIPTSVRELIASRPIQRKLNPPTRDQRFEAKVLERPYCNMRSSGHTSRDMSASLLSMRRRISMEETSGAPISPRLSMLQCAILMRRSTFLPERRRGSHNPHTNRPARF